MCLVSTNIYLYRMFARSRSLWIGVLSFAIEIVKLHGRQIMKPPLLLPLHRAINTLHGRLHGCTLHGRCMVNNYSLSM